MLNKISRASEMEHYNRIFDSKVTSMKRIWGELNKIGKLCNRKKSVAIPKLLSNGIELTNNLEISEEFNDYFCSIADKIITEIPSNIDDTATCQIQC